MVFFKTVFKSVKTAGVAAAVGVTFGQCRGLKRKLKDQASDLAETAKEEAKAVEHAGKCLGHGAATAGTAAASVVCLRQVDALNRATKDQADKFVQEGAGAIPVLFQLVPWSPLILVSDEIYEENFKANQKHYEGIKKLYHATNRRAAGAIVKSQKMRPGPVGEMGPGMYFATSPDDARRKSMGGAEVILKMDVDLGYSRRFSEHDRNWQICMKGMSESRLRRLQQQGFNSISLERDTGREYVVYEPERISNISLS